MPVITIRQINDIMVAVEKEYRTLYRSKNVEEKRTGFVGLVALKKVRTMVMDIVKKR